MRYVRSSGVARRRRLIVLEEVANRCGAGSPHLSSVVSPLMFLWPVDQGLWLPRVYKVWLRQRQSYAEGNLCMMPRHQVHGFSRLTGDP
jgi:hypothetical protein